MLESEKQQITAKFRELIEKKSKGIILNSEKKIEDDLYS